MTSRQPPQVGPVTERAGPYQLQGSVASRSPNDVSASGLGPVEPDVLGLARVGDLEPLAGQQGGAQRPGVDVVDARPGPRCTWEEPP